MDGPGAIFLTLGDGLRWLGIVASVLLLLPLGVLLAPGALGAIAQWLRRFLDRVSGAALAISMGAAILMVVAQLAVVVIRHVFGMSFSWLDETVVYSFAAMFLLAAAGALRDDAHVRVDIMRPSFSPRLRASIELAGVYLFVFPIGVLVLWAVEPSLARSWAGLEGSRESDGLPLYFMLRTFMPLFAVLLLMQGLANALKAALALRGLHPLEDIAPAGPRGAA